MERSCTEIRGNIGGNVERIFNVAERVKEELQSGNHVVVLVSAMGKTTDQFVSLANEISSHPSKREMDMLLATGEQTTIALLTMALAEKGTDAVSYTGWRQGSSRNPYIAMLELRK